MPASAQSTESAAWPEGVVARYLTVAGTALGREDLAVGIAYISSTGWMTATCAGCGAGERTDTGGLIYDTPEEEQARVEQALPNARHWAQAHAEKCRALPRPTA